MARPATHVANSAAAAGRHSKTQQQRAVEGFVIQFFADVVRILVRYAVVVFANGLEAAAIHR
jgi:hypothetical protein